MTTLAKSLKEKNKLKQEVSKLQKRLEAHNSIIKGNPRPFDLNEIDSELSEKIERLVILKSAITKANQPIQEKIYRLVEIKRLMAFYKELPVKEGKSIEKYSDASNEYEVFFNESAIDQRMKKLESDAETIQDELESFNHTTSI